MEKFIIATGKTIDLAVESALEQLHMDRDSVSVEVLENAKAGFLGIGGQPAKIKVTYEGPAENHAPALSSASRSKPKPQPDKKPQPEKAAAGKPAPANKPVERRQEPKPERRELEPAQPKPVREYAPAPEGSDEQRVERFLKGLLEHMGSDAIPHAWRDEDSVCRVDLVGESLGMLIGRRGETLDAIQHLANYAINQGSKHLRITVDAEGYRAKREEALRALANKVANKVLKYRRNVMLEPMNAFERHVIHAALQSVEGVTTFSTGTEPNRRVVVAYGDKDEDE
ncbi:MAG: RNA-binding cell elongation regulator Jag/EloR [Oscillospiraceae bacterium]|nr:RNA-binding cell elongation regulator Jag/EloR [Oscillospiraceae bacterium]